ncbi:MAG: response regulator [Candidatus Latescibacteria bacterium]|jgi:DNA-binding response OmpR family regulator|nr:response regulator [Candidatus Latescibacterota bacterium]MBT4140757.1 response regulator [Candidatus Latescibacterota bacterium]MBT5832059.1 response regulator [Candidatus Latescibacterota bacterium]
MSEKQNSRILIVDDTVKNIQVLGTILKQEGHQLNVAQNGQQALDVVGKVKPDLILLDVMMPEMDGFEACTHLKANPETVDIPVVFLTAKIETEDIVKGFDLGAVDYVTKPFNPTELLKRVDTHLSLYHLRRKLEELVAERTAHLQHRVRELDARDKLMHLQSSAGSLTEVYENILRVVEDVFKAQKVVLYRPDAANVALGAKAALGLDEAGVIQDESALGALPPVAVDQDDLIAQAFRDQKSCTDDNGAAATPILHEENVLGIIWVDTLGNAELDVESELEAFWRIGHETALVIQSAQVTEDLETGEIDVSALLNLDIEE